MKILDYKGTSEKAVRGKLHNIWIGISLGNKYFNTETLTDYVKSSLELSHDGMLIVVCDKPQSINYEVFERMPHETAIAKAIRNGDKVEMMLRGIIDGIDIADKNKIRVVRWNEMEKQDWYKNRLERFSDGFKNDQKFKNRLLQIVGLNMGERLNGLSDNEIEKLAGYIVAEFPIFMGAMVFDDKHYDLHLYPGLSLMDETIMEMQDGRLFPEITKDLLITQKLAIIEAYAE